MTENNEAQIDLSTYNARVFTGRNNGLKARKKFGVASKAERASHVLIVVPEDTKTLNSSFLLGLLGDEMVACGSEVSFKEKFEFRMPDRFKIKVQESIERALFNRNNEPKLIS